MIGSSADFRRKMYKERFGIIFKSSPLAANARAVVDVDAQGNATSKTLVEEYPAKSGGVNC
jgi:peroxiredoxin